MSSLSKRLFLLVDRHDVVRKSFMDVLLQGILSGKSVNGPVEHDKDSLLMFLTKKDLIHHIGCILESGVECNVNESDKFNRVPLDAAKSDQCVSMLLSAGADVNVRSTSGWTPLHTLSWHQEDEQRCAVQLLLVAGADAWAIANSGVTPLHVARTLSVVDALLENGAQVDALDHLGKTPLMAVICSRWHRRVVMVKRLIAAGANVNHRDNDGQSVLAHAIQWWKNRDEAMEPILAQLIVSGAVLDSNQLTRRRSMMSWFVAAESDCIRLLLVAGLKPSRAFMRLLTVQRYHPKFVLLPITTMYPQAMRWVEDDELKKLLRLQTSVMEERKCLRKTATSWTKLVFECCAQRVLELALVFAQLPTLIVAEICLFDQCCLRTVEEYRVWNMIDCVRSKKRR